MDLKVSIGITAVDVECTTTVFCVVLTDGTVKWYVNGPASSTVRRVIAGKGRFLGFFGLVGLGSEACNTYGRHNIADRVIFRDSSPPLKADSCRRTTAMTAHIN